MMITDSAEEATTTTINFSMVGTPMLKVILALKFACRFPGAKIMVITTDFDTGHGVFGFGHIYFTSQCHENKHTESRRLN